MLDLDIYFSINASSIIMINEVYNAWIYDSFQACDKHIIYKPCHRLPVAKVRPQPGQEKAPVYQVLPRFSSRT